MRELGVTPLAASLPPACRLSWDATKPRRRLTLSCGSETPEDPRRRSPAPASRLTASFHAVTTVVAASAMTGSSDLHSFWTCVSVCSVLAEPCVTALGGQRWRSSERAKPSRIMAPGEVQDD